MHLFEEQKVGHNHSALDAFAIKDESALNTALKRSTSTQNPEKHVPNKIGETYSGQ
jgi:hypothetical protein